jgi:hypothetical protein
LNLLALRAVDVNKERDPESSLFTRVATWPIVLLLRAEIKSLTNAAAMASVGALYPSQVANSSVIVGIREEKRSSITLCESIDIIGITNEEITSAKSGNTKPNALTLLRKSDCASFLRSGVPSAARIVSAEAIRTTYTFLYAREKAISLLPILI